MSTNAHNTPDSSASNPHEDEHADHSSKGLLEHLRELEDVEAEPRPDAHACGAQGHRGGDRLVWVNPEGAPDRVLCPYHVRDYLKRRGFA